MKPKVRIPLPRQTGGYHRTRRNELARKAKHVYVVAFLKSDLPEGAVIPSTTPPPPRKAARRRAAPRRRTGWA